MDNAFVNGLKVYAFSNRKELIDYIICNKKILIAINAEKILHASNGTRQLVNNNIGYSDGLGAVWALHKKGFKNAIKIPGCELWLDIIRFTYKEKSFYLIGSRQEVIEKTVSKLAFEFPGINILNYRNGYLSSDNEKRALLNDIEEKKPDIVFVALGSPRQEVLMEQMQEKHKAIYQGLGGSFDVYSGYIKRAPAWWIKHKLEWSYRLIKQPTRIKRQLFLVKFLIRILFKKL